MTNDTQNGCFRMTNNGISNNTLKNDVHETPWFRDYDVRIIKDSPYAPYGIYISSEFSNQNNLNTTYEGMFFHEEDNLISIELNTKDESLIAEAVSICKAIAENFCMLDDLLRTF